jgi:hypothetical protein
VQADDKPTPQELFDQRIMPIFRSPTPSSCVQCHLSSVDLKNYILPSQEKTFASLRDQGLIDLDHPKQWKILTLISMGEKDLDKGARLIHEKTRKAEYEAFAKWIEASCNDPELRDLPPLSKDERARPDKPDEVIRHSRKSRVVDSFVRNVWSQRMRCFPCHTPHEIDPQNRRHQAALKTRRQLEETWGEEILERIDFFKKTPEETLAFLIERSRKPRENELPLLDLDNPAKSLLVIKPLSKLPPKKDNGEFEPPSSVDPVSHGGGLKMHPDDQSYKSIVAWIQDYANVVEGKYVSVDDLPADNWQGTQKVIKLSHAPDDWAVGVPVQLFLHKWNEESQSWNDSPIAFTQGTVTPRRMVNGALFQFLSKDQAAKTAAEDRALGGGRYLVKVYVDSKGRLADDPALLLGDDDFAGQVELKQRRWREGFQRAPMVSAEKLAKP